MKIDGYDFSGHETVESLLEYNKRYYKYLREKEAEIRLLAEQVESFGWAIETVIDKQTERRAGA